jgi:hypothetical protein
MAIGICNWAADLRTSLHPAALRDLPVGHRRAVAAEGKIYVDSTI